MRKLLLAAFAAAPIIAACETAPWPEPDLRTPPAESEPAITAPPSDPPVYEDTTDDTGLLGAPDRDSPDSGSGRDRDADATDDDDLEPEDCSELLPDGARSDCIEDARDGG